jgi:thiosulfate/3-mercaptopyruvate sulfurtransferase
MIPIISLHHWEPEAHMPTTTTAPQATPIEERGYSQPEVLVTTEWVEAHLGEPSILLIECDEDLLLYEVGHVPGAVKIDWISELNDPLTRDYVDHARLQSLLRSKGVDTDTTLVLYGDKNNWWATYTFWVFRLFDLPNLRIMDGGRAKWEAEGRPMTTDVPARTQGNIVVRPRSDGSIRAFREDVLTHLGRGGRLVDVRSPEEFRGERLHMPDYPNEGALRGGHIPGAKNMPWAKAVNPETHTFRARDELEALYGTSLGLAPSDDVVTYCRIGERSSHTWFVLTYLLGYSNVRNYDGSWTEWGNIVRAPIEK